VLARGVLVLFLFGVAACQAQNVPGTVDAGLLRPDALPPPATSTTLVVFITEGEGGPVIPGRVVLFGEDGAPVRVGFRDMWDGIDQDIGFCDLAPGVIGTFDGLFLVDGSGEIPVGDDRCHPSPAVPFGRYRLVALQGIEHEMFETYVELAPRRGKVVVNAPLRRAWSPEGALSADLHVHADGSGDSVLPRDVRVISELVAGVRVIGASDHNLNGTFSEVIEALGLRGQIASLTGNEASADMIHASVFPAVIDPAHPRGGAASYDELRLLSAAQTWAHLRALPGRPLVQLNHPRLRFAAYFDYAGWDGSSWPPPMPIDFDAVEVVNGLSAFNLPDDMRIERGVQDLYTMVDNGHLVTGVGNSDTHHLTSVLAGVPRNYVFSDDLALDPFDEDGFIDAVRRRRVMLTTGPWLAVRAGGAGPGELAVATDGTVRVEIELRQATFVRATRVRLWLARQLVETIAMPPGSTAFAFGATLPVGATDTWIGVDAAGDEPLPRALHSLADGKLPVPPFAMVNPILVDADGDGVYTPRPAKPAVVPDLPPPPWDGRTEPAECGVPR
jgi:hypothetical protein